MWLATPLGGMLTAMPTKSRDVESLLAALGGEDRRARCDALRELCPCRNNQVRDLEVWRDVFARALHGGMRERDQAAHAIGTLTEKAKHNAEWQGLLRALKGDLDALMQDTRAARRILGQMKKHGHAHRGAAMQNYRRRRRALDLATAEELADWVNSHRALGEAEQVTAADPGVERLWHWLRHRVQFQPTRKTRERDLVDRARRYLPHLFEGVAA